MNLRTRVERLEVDDTLTLIRECPRCSQMVIWGDVLEWEDEPDLCQHHRPAPPPHPSDIVIEWRF